STQSRAEDINEQGLAVGNVEFADSIRVVSWDLTGVLPQMTQLFPDSGWAVGVNNSGDIIGLRGNSNFLFRSGTSMRAVATDKLPFDINNAGIVVGGTLRSLEYSDGINVTNVENVFNVINDLGELFGSYEGANKSPVVLNDLG